MKNNDKKCAMIIHGWRKRKIIRTYKRKTEKSVKLKPKLDEELNFREKFSI